MTVTREAIRKVVLETLAPNLLSAGIASEILESDAEVDLYRSGICDSFDIVVLVMTVEESTGLRCNLANESAEDFVLTMDRLIESFKEA
jgi:acyl carrier protein